MRTLVPGYPAVLAKLDERRRAREYADLFGGPARLLAGGPPGSTCSCSTRRISSSGPATRISAPTGSTGPTMPGALPLWRGRRRDRARRDRAFAPESSTPTTGRRRWRRPICITTADRAQDGHHDPQSRLPGTIPGGGVLGRSACPKPLCRSTGSNIRRRRLSEGGTAICRSHHHRVADLCARDPDAGIRHGAGRTAAARARLVHGILNGIDDTVWDPATDPAWRKATARLRIDKRARNKAALQSARPDAERRSAAVRRRIRLTRQKGLDLLLQTLPAVCGERRQLAVLGSGERALEEGSRRRRVPRWPVGMRDRL